MAYKSEIFEAVNLTLRGHYMYVCTVFKVISNRPKSISAKQGIHKYVIDEKV